MNSDLALQQKQKFELQRAKQMMQMNAQQHQQQQANKLRSKQMLQQNNQQDMSNQQQLPQVKFIGL